MTSMPTSPLPRHHPSDTMAFWRRFYARHHLRHEPSPFARWCLEHFLDSPRHLLELGCGNARDSFAFLGSGHRVLAVDGCEVAIEDNRQHQAGLPAERQAQFITQDLGRIEELPLLCPHWFDSSTTIDTIYSRFFLHAVPASVEQDILAFCHAQLPPGGLMLHEFRTTRDPLMQLGEVMSATERWTDHYRRFIDAPAFQARLLAQGWEILHFTESAGLAPFAGEDPVVARVVARRPAA